jgi:hypothetical protein
MAGWWRKRWPRMIGFDAGFIPQLLCVADMSPAGLAGSVCVLVVSLIVGIGLWVARTPGRVSCGRFMCLGAGAGFLAHGVVVLSRLS